VNQSTLTAVENRLHDWHGSPLGALLAEYERRMVAEALDDVFGLQLLQIGEWSDADRLLDNARTQRSSVITWGPGNGAGERYTPGKPAGSGPDPAPMAPLADARADTRATRGNGHGRPPPPRIFSKPSELPVASDSIDAVLLPHTLEFEGDPYAVLREVERVLVGEGHLLVLGFRPLGAWGLRHRMVVGGFPPGLARLLSEGRLRDWLALLAFEVISVKRFLHRLPVAPASLAEARARAAAGEWRVPIPSCAYLLKARKRVYTLTPVRKLKRERRAMVGGLVEPTTRQSS
jgi:SAM-dependent methyltransferase